MKIGRRMFLQGAGGAAVLAVPLLPSLLPRSARSQAAEPAVRYVQWVTDHGQYADRFWPNATLADTGVAGVRAAALSSISGRLSEVLGSDWDALRPRINLVHGLDLMVEENFHNACVPTCASWPRVDNHEPEFSYSVDAILEESSTVYPTPVRVPALRLTPGVNSNYKWGSFCWTTRNGSPFKLPCYDSTQTAFSAVFGDAMSAAGGGPQLDPQVAARVRLTDQVIDDYRAVAAGSSISAADRQQLTDYMDLLADVQRRMQLQAPDCTPPEQLSENDFDVLHRNAIDIAVAAMLCGSTRVVAYHCYQGSPSAYDEETFHAWAHDDASLHAPMQEWRYRQLARLIATMDSFVESNGRSLLDNSLVYASNELSDPGHGATHLLGIPIITAGSAGGRLVTGQYIDFGGRLMNNMLITVFAAMGLSPADYERDGVVGFGDYQGRESERYAAYVGDAERRKPLPYLYTGA
jgi:hypothetical protein